MDNDFVILVYLTLVVPAFMAVCVAIHIIRRTGSILNFRSMLIINYVLVTQISGIIHLLEIPGASRGYFDLAASIEPHSLVNPVMGSTLGLTALCLACVRGLSNSAVPTRLREPKRSWITNGERRAAWLFSLTMLPLTLFSIFQIQGYVRDIDTARVISVAEGYARYSFISGWFVWVVSFAAIALVSGRFGQSRLFVLIVAASSMIAIVLSLAWSGGRTVIIVMALPLLLVLLPKLNGVRWLALPAAVMAAVSYILSATEARAISSGGQLATWLDWEWGRFSLMGLADAHVDEHGFLYGETFLAGITNVLFGALRLVGVGIPNPPLRMSMNITGEELLNSSSAIHIVPGLTAELYMNFGLIGIIIGYYSLGRITSWVDAQYDKAPGAILRLAFAYLGTLLVFRTVSADSGAIYGYLLYTGLPLIALGVYSGLVRRRIRRHAKSPSNDILHKQPQHP
ncbi:hypothetical protein [Arthrobacter sp. LAR12-1-1.1]|uniref:hypothetical protein n=1 Tax=Arthrobacter sp. LAR12-1-1.1 TaxID=3135215 RepID=UPI00343D6A7F